MNYFSSKKSTLTSKLFFSTKKYWLGIVVIFIGFYIRIFALGKASLWTDEIETWIRSSYVSISDVFHYGVMTEGHPPLFYFIIHNVIKFSGDSEFWLRFPSAIFGSLAILMIFVVGNKFLGHKAGLISAVLMAFSSFPIYYSQEARSYALLLFLSISATYPFLKIIKDYPLNKKLARADIYSYAVLATLTAYTHYFGLYFIMVQLLILAALTFFQHGRIYEYMYIVGIIGLLYAPWLYFFWVQVTHNYGVVSWIGPVYTKEIIYFIGKLFGVVGIISSSLIVGMFAIIAVYAGYRLLRPYNKIVVNDSYKILFVCVLLLFLPIIGVMIASRLGIHLYTPRNLIIVIAPAYLIAAWGISKCFQQQFTHVLVCVMLAIYLTLYPSERRSRVGAYEQYREMTEKLVQLETVYGENLCVLEYFGAKRGDYYYKRYNINTGKHRNIYSENYNKLTLQYIQDCQEKYIVLLYAHSQSTAIEKILEKRMNKVKEYRFRSTGVVLWNKPY